MRKYFYCLVAKDGSTIGQVIYFGKRDDPQIRADATELLFKDHAEASPRDYELHVRWEELASADVQKPTRLASFCYNYTKKGDEVRAKKARRWRRPEPGQGDLLGEK